MKGHSKWGRQRPWWLAAAIVGFVLAPADTIPAVPTSLAGAPSLEELAEVRTLARLVPTQNAFHALRTSDLRAAPRKSGRDFEFVPVVPSEARTRVLRRLPHGGAISAAASRYRLDSLLLAAVVEAESGFDSRVVSSRGATGLMQIMPSLASDEDLDLFDPTVNLNLGAKYMSQLLRRFDGDMQLALAAYNAGPGAVERYGGMPPYRETNRFVRKVLTIYDGHRRGLGSATESATAGAGEGLAAR